MVKKGLVLILVLGVLAVLIIAACAVVSLTSGETRMVRLQNNSIRAFYLAEAGIEEAIYRLKKGDDVDFTGGLYDSTRTEYDVNIEGESPLYNVISTGSYPSMSVPEKVTRKVKVDISVTPNGDPSKVTNAIEANGEIKISGAVVINGGIKQNAALDFQTIFGITKEQMQEIAEYSYADPDNNKTPVEKITWVNLIAQSQFRISQTGWSGGGILVVKEQAGSTSPALEIEGGTFNGVIWVIGNLRISGNAVINGAIFVENGTTEVTKLTGTPNITYDPTKVQAAFKYLGNSIDHIYNWQEVQ